MKNILVAGGNGFIGTHLAVHLKTQGHNVIVVDNLSSSKPKGIFWKNLKIPVILKDIKNLKPSDFPHGLDQIYNLASQASPRYFEKFGFEILESNSLGHRNLLEMARHLSSKILFASTSEIYGEPLSHPQTENTIGQVSLAAPRAYYDESKRFAETMTQAYQQYRKVTTCTARIFNTYGPGMELTDGRVISELFKSYLNSEPFYKEGDGFQTRSFCYVDDTVSALEKLMNTDHSEPINIGNDVEISINELIHTFETLLSCQLSIEAKPAVPHSPTLRRPDIRQAQAILDWHPKTSLHDGLTRMLGYYVAENEASGVSTEDFASHSQIESRGEKSETSKIFHQKVTL